MAEPFFQSINPATGASCEPFPFVEWAEASELLDKASLVVEDWGRTSVFLRANLLPRLAGLLREQQEVWARCMAEEMGKALVEGRAEIEKCATLCEFYAETAPRFLEDLPHDYTVGRAYSSYRPLGVVLGVMPWNFPFWQVFRFGIPALMAGNGLMIKHAPQVPGCALGIEQIFLDAGFPEGLIQNVFLSVEDVPKLIQHSVIQGVSLTGSTGAGRAVAEATGRALKKTVLELGGSDPYIILEDADLGVAAKACVSSRLINAGQSCIAAKRFIAVDEVYEEFADRVEVLFEEYVVGYPLVEGTQLGPMARVGLRDGLQGQVEQSLQAGACLRWKYAEPLPEQGAWFPPMILENVQPGMPAFDEELFGPVAALCRARSEAEAIRLANHTVYGLGAAVFTRDVERGERIARNELNAGCCVVNDFVRSDPRLPFGGIRDSGYGHELSQRGMLEFTNAKTVVVSSGALGL